MKGMESWTRFSCHGRMPPAALARSVSRKCRTIPFFGRFLESCYIAHPRTRAKVPEKPVRGHEIGGRIVFRQKNVARFEICHENRNRATKFVVSFRGFLSLGRFSRHLPFSILQSA